MLIEDIPNNVSRYELHNVMPQPDELYAMWAGWMAVSLIASSASAFLFFTILTSSKLRAVAFNKYLAALTVPDFVLNFFSFCTYSNRLITREPSVSGPGCDWESFYHVFSFSGSLWLNAIVAREVYVLLRKTKALQTYQQPPNRDVLRKISLAAVIGLIIGCLPMMRLFPLRISSLRGITCLPLDYDTSSTIFFWLAYFPLISGIPSTYVIYLGYSTWREGLLNWTPRSSYRTRGPSSRSSECSTKELSIDPNPAVGHQGRKARQLQQLIVYFMRIFFMIIAVWGPVLALIYVFALRSPWPIFAGGMLGHMQGLISVMISMTKADIRDAVLGYKCCLRRINKPKVAPHHDAAVSKGSVARDYLHEGELNCESYGEGQGEEENHGVEGRES